MALLGTLLRFQAATAAILLYAFFLHGGELFAIPAPFIMLLGGVATWMLERRQPAASLGRRLLRYEVPTWLVAQPVFLAYAGFAGSMSSMDLFGHGGGAFGWNQALHAYAEIAAPYLLTVVPTLAGLAWLAQRQATR